MSFRNTLSQIWFNIQYTLFPHIETKTCKLSKEYKEIISVLELVRIEQFIDSNRYANGRPPKDRIFIARAFIAKLILKLTYTKQIIDLLNKDIQLKVICGWEEHSRIPHKSKFSRAFKEFAQMALPERVHQALVREVYKDKIIGHIGNDSTSLNAREKPLKKEGTRKQRKKVANDRYVKEQKGELESRRKRQARQTLDEMLAELPKRCDFGMKKDSQGVAKIWKGYKLHAGIDDLGMPVSVILTSASLNDCEVGIPLLAKSQKVVRNFYDLMDAAYDVDEIKEYSKSLNHVPIINSNPRGKIQKIEKELQEKGKALFNAYTAEDIRYKQRFPKERFNAMFKEYFGGRSVQYKGHDKVFCHAMFGILVYSAKTLMCLLN
jgi:hypothetical protein